jgi:ubiquinone/menaquinone biosynthesis C-methylase UbiE
MSATEQEIREFWNSQPCGTNIVPPSDLRDDVEFLRYLARYDQFRYQREGHILSMLERFDFKDKSVLEIGLGQGADSERLIRKGAHWSGVDLTSASIEIVSRRLRLKGLSYGQLEQGSVLNLPFDDHSFDVVYSFGVLHHVPDIARAQAEIRRVLKPGGRALIMLYAERSLNYQVAIRVVRRAGLVAAFGLSKAGLVRDAVTKRHVELAQSQGLLNYLRFPNFLNRNTDGPDNAFSRVYDEDSLARDFSGFSVRWTEQDFLHAPPLPAPRLPQTFRKFGWHLWALLEPRA